MKLTLELTRIALRYLGMFFIAKGLFDPGTAETIFGDPALAEFIAGGISAALAEVGYAAAKWRGRG